MRYVGFSRGFSCRGAQTLGTWLSAVAALGLSSCRQALGRLGSAAAGRLSGAWAQQLWCTHGPRCSEMCGYFPDQGLNLCFLHCRLSLSHRGHLNTSDLGLGDSAPIVLSFKLGVGPLHCPPNSLHHGLPILLPMAQRSKRSVSLPFIIIP